MELNFYICHKEVVNCGYLCIGASESHPSPLGWEMRDASRQGRAGPGRAGTGRAGPSRDGRGQAGPGQLGPGRAGPGWAGQGRAGPGRAGPGRAGPSRAQQGQPSGLRGQGRLMVGERSFLVLRTKIGMAGSGAVDNLLMMGCAVSG